MSLKTPSAWHKNRFWEAKLATDADRAARFLVGALEEVSRDVLKRAKSLGAEAVVLTGSTARGKRTSISDLDFLVVGSKPRVTDLKEDIDVHTSSLDRFSERLVQGDSFTHWALDHGCVLWDTGVIREGLLRRITEGLAPDPERLRHQYERFRRFAAEVVESEDADAAHRETLAALSLGARWWLLARGISPLARSELPLQLMTARNEDLASALNQLIFGSPSLESQSRWLAQTIEGPLNTRRAATGAASEIGASGR